MLLPDELMLDDLDHIRIMSTITPDITAVRLGLLCTFYVADAHHASVRQALASCGDQYLRLFGAHLSCYRRPNGEGRYLRYPKEGISLGDYLQVHDRTEISFAPTFSGGKNERDCSSYGLKIFAGGTEDFFDAEEPAYLYATMPFGWLQDKAGEQAFQKLIYEWCRTLKPRHGYAGIGALQSMDMAERRRTSHQAYALAARFPGLEIEDPTVVANYLHDGVKGVNWLTALDEARLERLGGRAEVLSQLDDNFIVYDYESGVLIQAGAMPQLGDVNRQHVPIYYRKLSNILKPIRMVFPEEDCLIWPLDGRDGTEVSNEWLARFD